MNVIVIRALLEFLLRALQVYMSINNNHLSVMPSWWANFIDLYRRLHHCCDPRQVNGLDTA